MADEQTFSAVRDIARSILQFDESTSVELDTPLLGHLPEFDSMSVVAILTAIEEHFGVMIDDDEVSAEIFTSWRSLTDFVDDKLSE